MTIHQHFVLNKPSGYISQFVDNNCKRDGLLGELHQFPEEAMCIGRLDKDSEGLLLITTDGKLSNYIRGHHIEKEYNVMVDGIIDDQAIEKLRTGVEIYANGGYFETSPCIVERLLEDPNFPPKPKNKKDRKQLITSWISITIREGRNRQIRKMTGKVGYRTLRLVRVRIGSINLNQIKSGEMLPVNDFGKDITEGYNEYLKSL